MNKAIDDRNGGRGGERTPTLLRFHLALRVGNASAPLGGGAGDLDARASVMSHLITKYLKLNDVVGTLQGLLGNITDPAQYDDVALRLAEARAEASLCKARYDAIDAQLPFATPPESEEDALLDAIRAVDRAVANTQAVTALLNAVHGLVQAYAARSTAN